MLLFIITEDSRKGETIQIYEGGKVHKEGYISIFLCIFTIQVIKINIFYSNDTKHTIRLRIFNLTFVRLRKFLTVICVDLFIPSI